STFSPGGCSLKFSAIRSPANCRICCSNPCMFCWIISRICSRRSLLIPICCSCSINSQGFPDFRECQGAHHALRHPFLIAQVIRLIESHHLRQLFQFLFGELFAVHQALYPLAE